VQLPFRPTVKRVDCDKTTETCAHIVIPHERLFILVFQEEWLLGSTLSTWNFVPSWPCWSENTDFQSIFAHSASAI